MALRNTSPSSKSSDYSEIQDVPIVPPQPVTRKECKEEVPDISSVSDIVDSKSSLLPTPNNILHANTNHASDKQQVNNIFVSKIVRDTIERTNAILDSNAGLPVMTYLNPGCQSCIINHAIMNNKGYNNQFALPKASAPILLPEINEQSDKEIKLNSEYVGVDSNKTCNKHVAYSSNHKAVVCNCAQLSSPLKSNEPETFQAEVVPNCCCSKDQCSKSRNSLSKSERHISSDSRLAKLRKSEEVCEKETESRNKLIDMNIMCPACFKKPCTCNFSAKEYNLNLSASSDALSSIWEYLKQQDQKIDSIHEKVSTFISHHASCLIDQSSQRNEFSNAPESDIPYILNILEVHSDKIRELNSEINLIKSFKSLSSPANNNKIDESISNQVQSINCVNREANFEGTHCPYTQYCPYTAVCHEQKEKVTKISTSTMTSFVTEKNDRLVYHKQKTVVSSMREEKGSPLLPNEQDSFTTKKNVDSNSKKRKSHKHNNCSPSLKSNQKASSNSSSDTAGLNDNQVPKTSYKGEKKSKHTSARNKVIPKVKKNVNDPEIKDNEEGKKNSPSLKTAALKAHSRPSKQKPRKSTSPKIIDTIRDLGNGKKTRQTSASSSSTDIEYKSTKQKQKSFYKSDQDSEETESDSEESTTLSKYGLSSKNLSKATKRYLDNYGLRRPGRLCNQYET